MISFSEALSLSFKAISESASEAESEVIALSKAIGRIVAKDIYAPLAIQPFDNSAMDGYAVHSVDVIQMSDQSPVRFKIADIIAAGAAGHAKMLGRGTCMKIMTGAPVPVGADAVIPYENAEEIDGHVLFGLPCRKGENIRYAGEDFRKGDLIIKRPALLETRHVLPLATLGIKEIEVYKKPTVFFISTGRELVNDLGAELKEGQIYNSNRPYALARLDAMGMNILGDKTILDDPDAFRGCLEQAMKLSPNFIISSGAVSAGDYDFVREELEKIGAEILFHKVRMKPGKPNLLARLPNGSLYFGLPGNPVATAVGLRFFVNPAMRRFLGLPNEMPVKARALNDFKKRSGLQLFLKSRTSNLEDGTIGVEFLKGQESFMVSPFLHMNAWTIIPEDVDIVNAGTLVDTYTA